MSSALTSDWINEHYAPAFYMADDGSVVLADTLEWGAMHGPIQTIENVRQRVPSKRVQDHAIPTLACRSCGEPSWSITRHAAERHGADVEVHPPLPGKVRPEWMRPDWI